MEIMEVIVFLPNLSDYTSAARTLRKTGVSSNGGPDEFRLLHGLKRASPGLVDEQV
jgi:hypothetical protein